MRKTGYLFVIGTLLAWNTSAQSEIKTTTAGHAALGTIPTTETIVTTKFSTEKTTVVPSRSYSHFDYNAEISSFDTTGGADFHFVRLWADSTIRQTFDSGTGTVNYTSVAQVIYPMDSIFNNPSNPANRGLTKITNYNAYKVDSVKISGLYLTGSTKSASIVDTLIISLTCQPSNISYYYAKTVWAGYGVDLTPYLTASDHDTLNAIAPLSADSTNKAALAYIGTPTRAFWKVPLTASMRSPIATAPIVTWAFAPPDSSYTIPAGYIPAVTFTFKSGDTWIPNVDNIDSFHRFLPLFGGSGFIMPYRGKFHNTIPDRSGSSLMFATHPGTGYEPTVMIEAENSIAFDDEYLAASFIISCPTCSTHGGLIGIDGDLIHDPVTLNDLSIFPNPSNEQVGISFTVNGKANVVISITDLCGKIVAAQNTTIQNAAQTSTVTLNTSALLPGIYICTITANGQSTTRQLTVVH